MSVNDSSFPWVSFCISTYRRPHFLKEQLALLLSQTDTCFEIVVSDNDPEASGRSIADSFGDKRVKYFHNAENLGMVKSFNKSIERASTEFIVMVTDDDPVEKNFLKEGRKLIDNFPHRSLYGGFIRAKKEPGALEIIEKDNFLQEILDPERTISLLWSSCILRRTDVLLVGQLPDFGSPHLADHALLVVTGSVAGGVVVNKMYSNVTFHAANFSKTNFEFYIKGCEGFYNFLTEFSKGLQNSRKADRAIKKHLEAWFISNTFNLKKYYSLNRNKKMLQEVDIYAKKIISFAFMRKITTKFYLKTFIFYFKRKLHLLK